MTDRIFNFSAGPAVLPVPVLEEAQRDMISLPGVGMSVMEISHRSKTFEAIIARTEASLRELLKIPSNYHVLFLQGGASLQFSMVPMNFLPADGIADYVLTGSWGKKALKEAKKVGAVNVAATMADGGFTRVPSRDEMSLNPHAAYVHITSNETIEGVQKNMGPSGVTLVIIRDDLLERIPDNLATMLDYRIHVENKSLYNTPNTWGIYIMDLVCKWLQDQGGLAGMEKQNDEKAQLLYDAIDATDFYRGHADVDCRSTMNVTYRLPSEELEKKFAAEATAQGLDGLKGHRSVGGIRASIYNAFPRAGVEALVSFMKEFQRRNG